MNPHPAHCRDANQSEILELEEQARQEHIELGIENPSDVTIQIRVRSLAKQRGLKVPGPTNPRQDKPVQRRRKKPPNYLQADLEQKGQQCAKDRRSARLERHIRIVRENTDRFYLFCFLRGGFAKVMNSTRACEVFVAVVEQLGGDVETWVSVGTLAERLGHTRKTVRKALRALETVRIITLTDASTRDYSLNGKPIMKNQGHVIQLHAPMFWDWSAVGGVPEWMKKYLADYD